MQVTKRTMSWFPKQSAWNMAEGQRSKLKANSNAYMASNEAVASTFQTVRDNLVFGLAENSAKAAAARVSKKA